MKKKQRIALMIIVLLIVGYGLVKNDEKQLDFYIKRSTDGSHFVKDSDPVFTNKDVKRYDHIKREIIFTDDYKVKIANGSLMTVTYKNYENEIIPQTDYWLQGISPLGAKYPDRFVIEIDGKEVLEGYFETAAYMSFLPPGNYIRTTENGVELIEDYNTSDFIKSIDILALYFGNI